MAEISDLDALVRNHFVNHPEDADHKTSIPQEGPVHGRAPKRIFLEPLDAFKDLRKKWIINCIQVLLGLRKKINFSH